MVLRLLPFVNGWKFEVGLDATVGFWCYVGADTCPVLELT